MVSNTRDLLSLTCSINSAFRYKSAGFTKFRLEYVCPDFGIPEQSNSLRKFNTHIATYEKFIGKHSYNLFENKISSKKLKNKDVKHT